MAPVTIWTASAAAIILGAWLGPWLAFHPNRYRGQHRRKILAQNWPQAVSAVLRATVGAWTP